MRKERKITNNCEKATFLIEKKKCNALSVKEKTELKIHLTGCEMCRVYQRQSSIIDKVAFNIFQKFQDSPLKLDENYKEIVQKRIDKKINEG